MLALLVPGVRMGGGLAASTVTSPLVCISGRITSAIAIDGRIAGCCGEDDLMTCFNPPPPGCPPLIVGATYRIVPRENGRLTQDGLPLSLVGATVQLLVRRRDAAVQMLVRQATIEDAAEGRVSYTTQPNDLHAGTVDFAWRVFKGPATLISHVSSFAVIAFPL